VKWARIAARYRLPSLDDPTFFSNHLLDFDFVRPSHPLSILPGYLCNVVVRTGLPGVIPGFPANPSIAITDVFFWTPQVIGGTGFIIASTLFMLECQKAWWKLNPLSLGWHVGFWNLVGSVGFTLCGALGYGALGHPWMNYQSILATFWGSWSFLIGSVLQLWESIWREDDAGHHKQ